MVYECHSATPRVDASGPLTTSPFSTTYAIRHEQVFARRVFLAGIPIDDKRVLTLAAKLRYAVFDYTTNRLETAYYRETAVLAVLLEQQAWRDREQLSA